MNECMHKLIFPIIICLVQMCLVCFLIYPHLPDRLTASDIMEPNLTYVYPHTRIQSLVSILRTTVYHAFPVVTENRDNEKEFMKGNILISNNIKFKVHHHTIYTSIYLQCFDHKMVQMVYCFYVSLSNKEMSFI